MPRQGVGGEFRKSHEFLSFFQSDTILCMRDIFTLFLHAIVIVIRLGRLGGLRSVVAESVLMRHQVLILNRGRKRAPNLRASDRILAGLCTFMRGQARVLRSAIVLKPSTLLHFHKMLTKQKYRLLFSLERVRRPGPKGPSQELLDAVVEMKRRNRTWGSKRIASRSVWPSASISTKTWSAEFSESISGRKRAAEVRHGCLSLVTRKTRCGHWIYFDVNRQY